MSATDDHKNFLQNIKIQPNETLNEIVDYDTDQDIIILNDDDFIQTTLNLLDRFPKQSSLNTCDNSPREAEDCNVLIDLTADFDLNDLFLMNSNNELASLSQDNDPKMSSKIDNNLIKDEIEFKNFNFDFKDSMKEILIDEEDDKIATIDTDYQMIVSNEEYTQQSFAKDLNDLPMPEQSGKKDTKRFQCEQCNKRFDKSYNYKRHLFMHKSQTSNQIKTKNFQINVCPNCDRQILDKSNFVKHLKICNRKNLQKKKGSILNDYQVTIQTNEENNDQCDMIESIDISSNKVKLASSENNLECQLCKKIFNKKFNFNRHLRSHFLNEILSFQSESLVDHNDKKSYLIDNLGEEVKFHECFKCRRKFNEQKQLTAHEAKWHLTLYSCKYCSSSFHEKIEHIKHLNSFHMIKFKFECKFCHKNFRYISHYIEHRRTHSVKSLIQDKEDNEILNFPSLKCQHCGKLFAKAFNLNRHISTKHRNLFAESHDSAEQKTLDNEMITDFSSITSNYNQMPSSRMRYDQNVSQKRIYEENKLNFHLSRVYLERANNK